MTIKDIANLADVSISTVSKVVNGKDQSIGKETREKVLRIVKEYHYTPYSSVTNLNTTKSFLIGVIIGDNQKLPYFIDAINSFASANGYHIVFCQHHFSQEEELKIINSLCKQKVDGVIWERASKDSAVYAGNFKKKKIPVYTIDTIEKESANNYHVDYSTLSACATKYLIDNRHTKIACFLDETNGEYKSFIEGYKEVLYKNQIEFDEQYVRVLGSDTRIDDMFFFNITGAVCYNEKVASIVYKQAMEYGYKIPRDLSVVSLGETENSTLMIPKLTIVRKNYDKLAEYVGQKLLEKIERKERSPRRFDNIPVITLGESVIEPLGSQRKKIIVVGSINQDMVINVRQAPGIGKTVLAHNFATFSGGKGANQAIGVARLGGEAHLIGRVGNDYDGKMLRDILNKEGVNVNGVMTDSSSGTGKAYICVQDDGESSIAVYAGVNSNLSRQDVKQNHHIFKGAEFCLLQLETSIEIVEYAANLAKQNNVKVILKPSAAQKISDYLLSQVDIFVPNESELNSLCIGEQSLEEKAQYFLDKGVKNIIVTMGHNGCYLKNETDFIYFPAADFDPVDTTGAADAFIAALAVYLADEYDLNLAIKYATYAAGISVTRQGVQTALVDKMTLETYVGDINTQIVEKKM